MSDNVIIIGILLAVLASFLYVSGKKDSDKKTSVGGGSNPSPVDDEVDQQRTVFEEMNVSQLKDYYRDNKNKLGDSRGRMPTKKADLVERALEIWKR